MLVLFSTALIHTIEQLARVGLIIAVYIRWHTFGERPHVGPLALLHWKRVPMHFLVMLSICVLNVSLLSSVIPRSLTSLLSSIVSTQTSMGRRDHFLFNVNMTIFVWLFLY